ncbi:MAG TPA: outer membrane protein assembly factor BamA [Thermoanaerobaculia bacterium]|nr:outer membrane protein assembly factor BamA [Thermoanaerobaculia bacterium]
MRIEALALAGLLLLPPTVGAQEVKAPEELLPVGPIVTAIEIRSEVEPDDADELARLLSFEVGEPLTEENIRSTLRNLQASGFASSAEIYTRPDERAVSSGEPGGVVAIVVLRPLVRVREVRLEGQLELDSAELRRVLTQKEAEPLSEEGVVQGVYSLVDLYAERGYFGAQVRVRVEVAEEAQQVNVVYDVTPGVRARVQEIRFEGDLGPFAPAELVKELRVKPGDPFSRPEVRQDGERLENWLIGQGRRRARVGAPAEEMQAEGHSVRLLYPIDVGPKVEVQVIGDDLERLRRRDLLPFLDRQGYDEALVLQSVERIKREYQQDGHYKVKVDWEEQEPNADLLRVVLRIEPGPQYTLRDVGFSGNETFDEERLSELIVTSERTLLARGSGRLVQDVLDDDLENVRRFYQLQGFAQSEVGPPQIEEQGDELRLTIPIKEGPRMRVVNLNLEGIESLPENTLKDNLLLTEGGPFHPYLLETTLRNLRAAYQDLGYSGAQVSARQDWNVEHTLVDVSIDVLEGPQTLLDRVIVRGNRRTESEVIRRTLAVDRGDPISERRALEIERDLYRLGVFSSVDVEVTSAGPESDTRDLIVRVEEGRPRRVSYGLGLEYGSDKAGEARLQGLIPRGSVSFSHNNVAGKAFSLRTDFRVSRLDQIFRVRFDQPYTVRWAVPVGYSLFYFNEIKEDWDVARWGARIESEKDFGGRRVGLILDYRIVDTTLDPDFPLRGVDREDRPYQLSSLIPTFIWDRRDDPILATRGWSTLAQLQHTFPAFGTDGDFLKLFVQQTQYLNLRNYGVVAASLRAGGIEPFSHLAADDPELPENILSADVFIDERFFAGGAATHRAYGRDDLGLRGESLILRPGRIGNEEDDWTAVGGTGLLLFNLEYRFPLVGALGGTVFYDAGNVWANWRDLDPAEVKSGAGVGVRYLSPIGPLRLDFGWKLDREPGEQEWAVSLSFGNPF